MSKLTLFLTTMSSALLGGAVVAIALWAMINMSGALEDVKSDIYGAGAGYQMLENYECKYGEAKKIIMRGVDDDFALGTPEPSQTNDRLSHLPGIAANQTPRRDYDEGGRDKFLSDYFDMPANITKGIFVTRLKPGSPASADFGNDLIQIGFLGDRKAVSYNGAHHVFHGWLNELSSLPRWTLHDDLYSVPLDQLVYRTLDESHDETISVGQDYKTLLDQHRDDNSVKRIDFTITDDTRVDFAGIAYCEFPTVEKGLTFKNAAVFDNKLPDHVVLACDINPYEDWCNPMYGDTACNEPHPLACFLDDNSPVPDIQTAPLLPRTFIERYWSGGKIAFTPAVIGSKFETIKDVNAFCASTFGKKWRALDYHDSNRRNLAGELYGDRYQGKVWIDIKDQPNGTCWAREAAQ